MYDIKNSEGRTIALRQELLYARDEAQRLANLRGETITVETGGVVVATCEPMRTR